MNHFVCIHFSPNASRSILLAHINMVWPNLKPKSSMEKSTHSRIRESSVTLQESVCMYSFQPQRVPVNFISTYQYGLAKFEAKNSMEKSTHSRIRESSVKLHESFC